MAELVPTVISVPMGAGMDTKNHPILVGQDKLSLVQNAKFTKGGTGTGQLQSRYGFALLESGTAPGSLAQLSNELLAFSGNQLEAYSPAYGAFVPKGTVQPCIPSLTQIVNNNSNQSCPDAATLLGVTVYSWIDSRGGVWAEQIDQASGTVLYRPTQLDSTGTTPRCIALASASTITVLWAKANGHITRATFDATSPGAAPTIADIQGGTLANTPFEAVFCPGTGYVAIVFTDTSSYVYAHTFTSAWAGVASSGSLRSTAMTAVAINVDGAGDVVIASQGTATALYVDFLNPTTLASLDTYNQANLYGSIMTIAPDPSLTTTVYIYQQLAAGVAAAPISIWSTKAVRATGLTAATVLLYGVGLVSTVFTQGAGSLTSNFMLVGYPSSVQPTLFLYDLSKSVVVGRYLVQNAGALPVAPMLTHPTSLSAGVWLAGITRVNQINSAKGEIVFTTGLSGLNLDFTQANIRSSQLGQALTIAGGMPQIYDGSGPTTCLTEDSFNMFPEQLSLTLLTSQIGITNIVDGAGGVAQSFDIVIPESQVAGVPDGQLILNTFLHYGTSEYVTVGNSTAFAFSVDGQYGAPPLGSLIKFKVPISVSMSASQIATALAYWINNETETPASFEATVLNNIVTCTCLGASPPNAVVARPQTFSQFEIWMEGGGSSAISIVRANMVRGNLINGGQYFTLDSQTSAPSDYQIYVWFSVDGVGTDPAPPGFAAGVLVAIASTDSETAVATKAATAINAAVSAYITATSTGPFLTLTNVNDGLPAIGPANVNVGAGLGTVGAVASNQYDAYDYTAIFESVDAKGQLGRSAPAVSAQIYAAAYGLGNVQVQVKVNGLYLTQRTADIAIYRTLTLGQLFYRQSSVTTLLSANSPSTLTTIQDSTPDTALESNELMYCQPLLPNQVIPNNPPPACSRLANFQDQLWLADTEDPQLMWFSKSFESGVQVEWSNEQTYRFDPSFGPVVTAVGMDSALIVLASGGLWAISGDGPDATGNGAPFTVQLISSTVGCRDANSVVLTPIGIVFKSAKGFMLLDRSLQVHLDFGDPVFSYNADVVTAAVVKPGTTEIIFLSSSGTTQLFDYEAGQWSTQSYQGADAVAFQGSLYVMDASGDILEEQAGLYTDDGTGFTFLAQTGWWKPGAIQGFGMIWQIYLLGNFPAGVGVELQIAYDYGAIVDSFTVTPTGNETQIPFFPSRPECEAIQITVMDTGSLSSSAKIALTSIDFECGVEKGVYKGFNGSYVYPQPGT